ncbi:MAG: hypothetical protein HQK54_16190 [Oligoflexales bacterium]|nr:hypothetical protein [Oligoflexales bacterium]
MSIDISGRDGKVNPSTITISISSTHPLILLANLLPWATLIDLVVPDLKKSTWKGFWLVGRKLYVRIHLAIYLLHTLKHIWIMSINI